MARITVEDCEKVVSNRFDLVILAAQRTRQILAGDKITVSDNDEKKPVVALREIAAESVSVDNLKEQVINGFRAFVPSEDGDDEEEELLEEDTYNPYAGIEVKAVEKENISVLSESEIDANDSSDEV